MKEMNIILIYFSILIVVISFYLFYNPFDKSTSQKAPPFDYSSLGPIMDIFNIGNAYATRIIEEIQSWFTIEQIDKQLYSRANINILNLPEKINNNSDDIKKYSIQLGIMLVFTIVASCIIYYASTDKNALTSRLYFYLFFIMIPCGIGLFMGKKLFASESAVTNENIYTYIPYISAIFFFIIFINLIPKTSSSIMLFNYLTYLLLFLIIVVGLAIIYFVFVNYLKQQTGALGLLIHLIFYIPCLFSDFIQYLKEDLAITPPIVFLLFIIEIILIIIYFYVPKLASFFNKLNSNLLLNDPVELNKELIIADSSTFLLNEEHSLLASIHKLENKLKSENAITKLFASMKNIFIYDKKSDTHPNSIPNEIPNYRNNNYAISFWVYVNPGAASTIGYEKESTILDYAEGKPKITYVNNGADKKNKYIVYFSNNKPEISNYELTVTNQQWLFFAINYYDSTADLFINGNLERSMFFNNENIPYTGRPTDSIKIGDKNGLNGAICSVNYYSSPMSIYTISNTYNILRYKNPPVILSSK